MATRRLCSPGTQFNLNVRILWCFPERILVADLLEGCSCANSVFAVLLPPRLRCSNALGRLCLCVCPVRALTFERIDLKTSFWHCMHTFRISRPIRSYIKVIGSRSSRGQKLDHASVIKYTHSRVVRRRLKSNVVGLHNQVDSFRLLLLLLQVDCRHSED